VAAPAPVVAAEAVAVVAVVQRLEVAPAVVVEAAAPSSRIPST